MRTRKLSNEGVVIKYVLLTIVLQRKFIFCVLDFPLILRMFLLSVFLFQAFYPRIYEVYYFCAILFYFRCIQ